jgi:hypothetical protein
MYSWASGACLLLAAAWAQAQAPACLTATPAPTSAKVTYGGTTPPATAGIEKIMAKCVRLNYGGGPLWTTADAKGGITCEGKNVMVDYTAANAAFNNVKLEAYTPASCARAQAAPSGPPPAPSGTVLIYYDNTMDLASMTLTGTSANCYNVNYGGSPLWFPKSALGYRTGFVGNPVGLDYSQRRSTAC